MNKKLKKDQKSEGCEFSDNLEFAKEEIVKISSSSSIDAKIKLLDLLDCDSPGIVESARNAILEVAKNTTGRKEIIKKLMDISSSSTFSIKARSNAFEILKDIAQGDGNFLIDFVGVKHGKFDRVVAEIMRYGVFTKPGNPKTAILALSESEDEIVRANAIESAGILKINPGNVLMRSLNDRFFVLSAALFAIGELKLKKAIPKLKEMLLVTRDRVIKNMIVDSISKIGGEDTTDFLLYLLNNNARLKIDKIYILKSLYKICLLNKAEDEKGKGKIKSGGIKSAKEALHYKLSRMNLKISIFSLMDYDEKDAVDAILCYFSLLNHKKSVKAFKFVFEFYLNSESLDENEYEYVKNIIKKIARPKHIIDYIASLNHSSESMEKIELLIDVLSDISPKDIINLMISYKNAKVFVWLKIYLLTYAARLNTRKLQQELIKVVINSYLGDDNGDVRKNSIELLGNFAGSLQYMDVIFEGLLKENYQDVADTYVSAISLILRKAGKNKKYKYFFIENLSSRKIKAAEYSLRILGDKNLPLDEKEIACLYNKISLLRNLRSLPFKRLLAVVLRNLDLAKHKEETAFLLNEEDEQVKFNYLESLIECGEKNPSLIFEVLGSGKFSEIFRYKMVELIQQTHDKKSFEGLSGMLKKEKSKIVKIALLRALYNIDKKKSGSILERYKSSRDKDLRNFSLELAEK